MGRTLPVVFLVILAACGGSTPTTPSAPAAAPSVIILTPNSVDLPVGGGATDIEIVTAASFNGGAAPNIDIALTATDGSLSATSVRTNGDGRAKVTWSGAASAVVTARAGELLATASIRVAAAPTPQPQPPPTPTPTPTPNPTPNPSPTPTPTPSPSPTPTLYVSASSAPEVVPIGGTVTFTAVVTSNEQAGTVTGFDWDFGDGVSHVTTAPQISTSFSSAGQHAANVQVRTDKGLTASSLAYVTVLSPVTLTLSASPSPVTAGSPVTLTATLTSADAIPHAGNVYTFDLTSDGTVDTTTTAGTSATTTTTYAAVGTYTVTATATTADGRRASKTLTVTVVPRPLIVSLTASTTTPTAGSPATFTATTTSLDPPAPGATYQWDWNGDGTYDEATGTANSAAHTFAAPGAVVVGVKVTALDGRTQTATIAITVQ